MCGHHHEHAGRRGFGFRRHGVPSPEEWVERLESHRERLQRELANIEELLKRLKDAPAGTASI
jgi:hypothetical protein